MCQLLAVILKLQLPVCPLANDEPINRNADFDNLNAPRKLYRLGATAFVRDLPFGRAQLSGWESKQRDNLVHRFAVQPTTQLLNLIKRWTFKFLHAVCSGLNFQQCIRHVAAEQRGSVRQSETGLSWRGRSASLCQNSISLQNLRRVVEINAPRNLTTNAQLLHENGHGDVASASLLH